MHAENRQVTPSDAPQRLHGQGGSLPAGGGAADAPQGRAATTTAYASASGCELERRFIEAIDLATD